MDWEMEVIEGSILISSTANFEDIFVEVKEWFDCIITDCIDTYFNNSCRISDIIDFLKENDVKDVGITAAFIYWVFCSQFNLAYTMFKG